MSGFVQLIEFRTDRIHEIEALAEEVGANEGSEGSPRGSVTRDRDRPGWFFTIVEFDSYESAMANSGRPEVSDFATRMAALCEEPPRFHNLDVLQTWSTGTSTTTKAAVATAATAVAGAAATGLGKARQRLQERRAQQRGARTVGGTMPTRMPTGTATEAPTQVPPQAPPPRVVGEDTGTTPPPPPPNP